MSHDADKPLVMYLQGASSRYGNTFQNGHILPLVIQNNLSQVQAQDTYSTMIWGTRYKQWKTLQTGTLGTIALNLSFFHKTHR